MGTATDAGFVALLVTAWAVGVAVGFAGAAAGYWLFVRLAESVSAWIDQDEGGMP
jgi:hypothetical protein